MPEYYYEDEGAPIQQRTSTRHYQPTQQRVRRTEEYDDYYDEPITQRPQRRSRTTESHPPIQRASVPARATGQVRRQQPQQYVEPPVQRQRVYQPPAQPQRLIQPEPQPEMSRRSFLGITRKGLFQTAGAIGGLSVLGIGVWTRSEYIHVQGQLEEGMYASTTTSVVCGHNDSTAIKTQLHAYIQPDGKINFIELPGGNPSKAHLNQTQSVREVGYSGPLTDLYLTITIEPATATTYQVRLHAEAHSVGIFTASFSRDWILADQGKGYFQVVNPSK